MNDTMMHIRHPSSLNTFVGKILNANRIERAAFLSMLIAGISLLYGIWALMAYYWPYAHQFIDPQVIGRYMPMGGCIICASFVLYLTCRYASTHACFEPWSLFIQTTVATFYALDMIFFGYLIGTMSMAAGAVLLGSPIFGWFLLDSKAVYFALFLGLFSLFFLGYLSVNGTIAYAPLLIYQGDISTTGFWFCSMMLFILPYWFVVCVLCDLIIRNLRQREADIRFLAEHDALTGLHNRHFLDQAMPMILQRAEQQQQTLSIVALDLDHFKHINDQFGHLDGDRVLVATAQVIQHHIRHTDIAGRFGGEEFVLILPNTDPNEAQHLAQRIREQLLMIKLNSTDNPQTTISVSGSFGVTSSRPQQNLAFNQLMHQADQALYQAKAHGRNCVQCFHS